MAARAGAAAAAAAWEEEEEEEVEGADIIWSGGEAGELAG